MTILRQLQLRISHLLAQHSVFPAKNTMATLTESVVPAIERIPFTSDFFMRQVRISLVPYYFSIVFV